jgi:hypothetical protein
MGRFINDFGILGRSGVAANGGDNVRDEACGAGLSDRDEDRYRLSDGRDARELLDAAEALLKRGEGRAAKRLHRTDFLTRSDADKEKLLNAANQRWEVAPRAPGSLSAPDDREGIMFALKNELVYSGLLQGTTIGLADVLAAAVTWGGLGILPDVRDADTIAHQFLARVD